MFFTPPPQKDHLLNDNEEFDYGPFDRLDEIMSNTEAEYYSFVHEFPDAGTLLFSTLLSWHLSCKI